MCRTLARALFDTVEIKPDSDSVKQERLKRAMDLIEEALTLEGGDESASVHKWKAILISEISKALGTKERIKRSFDIKAEALRAAELDDKDPTPQFLLGVWCYEVASIGWMTRKIAAAIFAEPPTATYEEALEHLLKCHELNDKFKRNIHSIVKTYQALNQTDKAKEYARLILEIPSIDEKSKQIDEQMRKLVG